jgi:2-polyprenyl-6-methoxyphenol hydroxylase-like FAD-dependent oxidoreductase
VLAERGPVSDPGAPILLERYARRRALPVFAMQAVTDGLARLFGPHAMWVKALRNTGMSAVDRLPVLKRALAQPALR